MSKAKFAAAAVVFFCAAASVQAQSMSASGGTDPAAQSAPTQASKPTRDPNQVICKREAEPGSRLGGHQDCRTRADWDQVARDSAEAMTNMQSKTNTGAPGH